MTDTPNEYGAWQGIRDDIGNSPWTVDILPGSATHARAQQLGLTAESALGAILLHSGGLVIDQGYIRVLGGGSAPHYAPDLLHANDLRSYDATATVTAPDLVVGYDVLGGVFVLNGSDPADSNLPGAPGRINYYPPDSLQWYYTDLTYRRWLSFLLSHASAKFFARWEGWQDETRHLRPDQGLSVYPPLWSDQASDIAEASRRPAPMSEVIGMRIDYCQQLDTAASCPPIRFV